MDFSLSEDQRALRAGMRELLAGRFGRERMRAAVESGGGVDRGLWAELGAAGFFALRLPEAEGGVGLGLPESVLLFEEAGRVLLPGPLVATHLAAGVVKGAAEGRAVVTVLDRGGPVQDLGDADALLVLGEVVSLAAPDSARGAVAVRSVDPLTALLRPVRPVVGAEPLPAMSGGTLRYEGALLTAAEQLGSAARTLEAAVQHARGREQFGVAIGSFQAVKHLCAQMLVRTELARAAVYAAAVTGDPAETAGAKLLADEAAVANARDCLQVHGGMGFTWEADVHLHLKRAWLRSGRWLTAAEAEEALASDLGAGEGAERG
ncbi:acyl-CoA dehydrogenase [Streptomyces finlayi]|uniref:Acyl-CoA dehydrogenase n=1 Tax=Streptomyces finlayi TaxID=67296 RepID=A0A7G7BK44_9ACTN|nr:acyl-CoA dehydrogenase family protein [Streptomyces finlayi]QNE75709.1 acyl-CoA dehydrogenase [Streptomyces finlayi]